MFEKWNRLKNVLDGDFELDEITTRLLESQFDILMHNCKTDEDIEANITVILDFAANIQKIPVGRTVQIYKLNQKRCKIIRGRDFFDVV